MKKIDLGQTVQVAANLGMIASIVFLAIQIRQTNNAVNGAAYQARGLALMQRSDMLGESTYLTPITEKMAAEGYDALSSEEKSRLRSSASGAFYRIDATFYQYELGLLSDDYYDTVFDAEMRLWVPRWIEQGILERQRERAYIRPTFEREIEKYEGLLSLSREN